MDGNYFVRLAEFDDVKDLNELVSSTGGPSIYKATFGAFNFSYVIEHSFLSVIATADTEENEMKGAGFASSNDALPALLSDGDLYPIVFEMLINHFPATTDNTNFINFWILDENTKYSKQIGDEMLKKLFALSPAVDYLVWLCPKSFIPIEYVTNTFKEIKLQLSENDKKETIGKLMNCKALYVHRSKFLPKLLVRDAKVEDNDDLIPILRNSNNPNILNHQNEYFLSDLIDSQDNYNRFYVGLNHTTIVGMLATSEDVNVPLITKIFQIDQFNDIIMEKTERELPPPLFIAIVGDIRLLDLHSTNTLCTNMNCVFVNAEVANINNQNNNESKVDEDDTINQQQSSEFNSLQLFLQQLAKEYDMRLQSAIIFFGYPSNEYEAYERRSDLVYQFDYIIEIINNNDDAEEDDDDDYLQHHLDAVEILRDKFSHVQVNTTKTIWKKISLDGAIISKNDSVYILREELNLIIDQRYAKIEAQRIKDRDDPPKANAFAITVFCLTDDYVSRAYDMIQVAFDDHPRLDYLFYMVPNIPPPPTELIKNMYYVPIKPGTSFDQSLYLMHRSSLLLNDFFTISRYNFNMKPKFHTYITTKTKLPVTKQQNLYDAANNCLKDNDIDIKDNPGEICFIINIGNHIIGMLTLSRKIITNDDSNWIRANYYADEIINYDRHRIRSQVFITNWYLESLYASSCTRRIIQEVMRRCLKTLVYYQIDHQHHHNSYFEPPKELINELITLKPRKRMQATNELKVEYITRPSIDIGGLSSQSPLLFLSKFLLARPKSIIPKRIVIAGGNSHSYAILETLCSVPYLNFPNIYLIMESIPTPLKVSLVSSAGGDEESKYDDDYSGCLSIQDEQFPTEQYLYSLGMGHKLKVVRGHLTDIDREHRTIVISNEVALEYDLLVIATNMEDGGIKAIPSLRQMHPSRCADSGIFSLGSPSLDRRAMEYIMKRYPVRTDDVIISGTGIAAYAAISSLINMGIASNRITLLVKSEEQIVDETLDKFIGDAVMRGLQSTGVKIYWGYAVSEIHLAHTGFLSSVEVKKSSSMSSDASSTMGESKSNSRSILNYSRDDEDDYDYRPQQEAGIMLACLALLCCSQPQCSRDIFHAINDCGLVYDGGLVVDSSFRTVDKAIYSVGDYTRFSRIHKNPIPHKK